MNKLFGVLIACLVIFIPTNLAVPKHSEPLISLPDRIPQNKLSVFHPSINQDIVIVKADSNVSKTDVQDVSFILQNYSIPTLAADIHPDVSKTLYIRLFESKAKFEKAVRNYFPLASQTRGGIVLNGFANRTTAFIPMYKYRYMQNGTMHYANSELTNYLTHELTHAVLNADSISIPVWINEGFAWYNGINAETKFNASRSIELSNSNYYNLDYAAQTSGIVPLQQTETEIFKEMKYNLEFEDYAAVSELISDYGLDTFRKFVLLTAHESSSRAYQQTYHSSITAYEKFFYEYTSNE